MTTRIRTIRDAEIPPDSQRINVLERTCLHGGPVTVATIRFPPPPDDVVGAAGRTDEGRACDERRDDRRRLDVQGERGRKYGMLKSRGRVVFARGPWIESHPLFGGHSNPNDGPAVAEEESRGQGGVAEGFEFPPNDERRYKILAYGGTNVVGGSSCSSRIECVNGMIFPSSAPSLAYLKSSSPSSSSSSSSPDETEAFVPTGSERSSTSLSISIVAYGGRRVSFLSGGGLWNRLSNENNRNYETATRKSDEFQSISIQRVTSNRKLATDPYLEVSDWIHDIRMLDMDYHRSSETKSQVKDGVNRQKAQIIQRTTTAFLMAMAMANNSCEIWGFHSTVKEDGRSMSLCPARLQCIACDVRCMTYSLALFGWNFDIKLDVNECVTNDSDHSGSNSSQGLPALIAASGTVFGDIVVWGVVDDRGKSQMSSNEHSSLIVKRWLSDTITERNDEILHDKTTRIRVSPLIRLQGHLGSVYKVKFSECGSFIASTSDDRTVRLWRLAPMSDQSTNTSVNDETDQCARQKSATEILALDSSRMLYTLAWTGWGHSARVWDVSFASLWSYHRTDTLLPMLVSAGEDGTARVWSPLSSTKEISHPLRGHRCESIWTVDVCEGIAVTGGNDGCVKLFGLESRVRSKEESVRTCFVPKDPLPTTPVFTNIGIRDTDPRPLETDESDDRANANARKKKKKKDKQHEYSQVICGMVFYRSSGSVQNNLLVATRGGGLFSLDLAGNAWNDHSSWSEHVMSLFVDASWIDINPSTGSCVGAHPSGKCAVVGTTEGWLVISSLCESSSLDAQSLQSNRNSTNVAFRARSYRPVQSVTFIDSSSLLVFYARGLIIWFKFDQSPTPLYVMKLETMGIPLSFAGASNEFYIGDSRGNIAYFALNETCPEIDDDPQAVDVYERKPNVLLTKVHGKEHVTGIVITSTGFILSVGNDGCMHKCKRDANGQLRKLITIPVPNVTGLRHIWTVPDPTGERVILGGFYGNDFVMLDSTNGYYELLRIATGGRHRRQDLSFDCNSNAGSLQCKNIVVMAILTGQKDGFNSIDIHWSRLLRNSLANIDVRCQAREIIYSIGPTIHGETINDACWVEDDCGNIYLLTGSNDCTVTLSKLKENKLDSTVELPPHESCVRGVCSSGRLLVTCGGKLSIEFYILGNSATTSMNGGDPLPCFVSLLCSYRTLGKSTIDHRMNSVRATSLFPPEKQCHLVLAGDSDGNLHLCVISEQAVARRTIIGTKLQGNGRPVLCLALLRCNYHKILAFVGTTGGEISVWELPGIISIDGDESHELDGIIPTAPVYSFKAHQTGVNDVSVVANTNSDRSTDKDTVIIASVGDDQALSTCVLEFTSTAQQLNASVNLTAEISLITKCASASALKAVKIVSDSDFHRIYTTHSAEITLWHLFINKHELSVKYIFSSPLETEGSCIDCICQKRADGSVHDIIAVGGEGVAVLSLNINILHAAHKLYDLHYNYATHTLCRYMRILMATIIKGARPSYIPQHPMMPVSGPPWSVTLLGLCLVCAIYFLLPCNEWGKLLFAAVIWDRYLGEPPLSVHPVCLAGSAIGLCLSAITTTASYPPRVYTNPVLGFACGFVLLVAMLVIFLYGARIYIQFADAIGRMAQEIHHASGIGGGDVFDVVCHATTTATITTTTTREKSMLLLMVKHALEITSWILKLILLKSTLSLQLLCNVALQMAHYLERNQINEARIQLAWLCSRDASMLDSSDLAGATLESLSENLSDGFIAPLFWYVLLGHMGALGYRIINTLDSRIGYRGKYEWFGKASARLDDLVNFVPARLTAVLLSLAAFPLRGWTSSRHGLQMAWRDVRQCESPNAGWPMACFAGVLGVRLQKEGAYCLGADGRNPGPVDIRVGHRVAQFAGAIAVLIGIAISSIVY